MQTNEAFLHIRVPREALDRWTVAATQKRMTLSAFVRGVLDDRTKGRRSAPGKTSRP